MTTTIPQIIKDSRGSMDKAMESSKRAPQMVPLTYHVCCIRVSFESGVDST